MNNLNAFKTLMKPKEKESLPNNHIVGYSRVSSKQQSDNFSIEEQEREIKAFAKKNNYILDKIIGGTYESASGDFSRKEFKKLYDEIKKSKKRPYAIAIKFINRFSRSGAGAISIVQELVEKLGVHLIETSTGLCTDNLKSRTVIYHKLLEAMEENHERLERTLPGMKTFLRKGNWLGVAPFGYTMMGPRVVDYSLKRENQEIVINKEGEILKKAWQWKLQGDKDYEILKKMAGLGVHISKQKLSTIWRNPFYCGVIINSLLDEPIEGKMPPMVSKDEFFKVQNILKPSSGEKYKIDNQNNLRPFTRFLICSKCGNLLTGYVVKSKNVHYYKCNVCHDVNLNADTTKRSKTKGLHNSFQELLAEIELKKIYTEPFKLQMKKIFHHLNAETKVLVIEQKKNLKELEEKLCKLEEKYIFEGLKKEVYEKYKDNLDREILEYSQNIEEMESKLSNHSEFIDKAIDVSENLSKYWGSGSCSIKNRIQKTVFPKGLVIDPQNRTYRTKNINAVFDITNRLSGDNKGTKKEKVGENTDLSWEVAGAGLEPTAFGL